MDNIVKSILGELDLIKAKRHVGLTKKTVIDKNGQVRVVWVRMDKPEGKKTESKSDPKEVLKNIEKLKDQANRSDIGQELREEIVSKLNQERDKWSKMESKETFVDDMVWQRKANRKGYTIEEGSRAGEYNLRKHGGQTVERNLTEREIKNRILA